MHIEKPPHVVVIGGGPAGLFAAETAATGKVRVSLYEAKASVGRKLLVAGKGGLNLTHGEDADRFISRYHGAGMPVDWWRQCLSEFPPDKLRAWAAGLGIETFQQRTGRVYPREMKAAPLLRRWVERLRSHQVSLFVRHRLIEWHFGAPHILRFSTPHGDTWIEADAVIMALGGASWSITGSDGQWTGLFERHGVRLQPWQAANCGWEVAWPENLVSQIEGKPWKNLEVSAGGRLVSGELMLTRYGLEGGIIYQLGPELRAMAMPEIFVDMKPGVSESALVTKMESVKVHALATCAERWRLSPAAHAILQWAARRDGCTSVADLARLAKCLRIPLLHPRPIDEAISSAGGVAWSELNEDLSLRKTPGVFVAGEMVDWEAPTGGYLMQGCFAMGRRAAIAALAFCEKLRSIHR
ncbi:MAG: NAD(P)/FAD-dependent oxidoreductase [Akkermansiaceae bacterium]